MSHSRAGIACCVTSTDGIPVQDMMKVKRFMRGVGIVERPADFGPVVAEALAARASAVG